MHLKEFIKTEEHARVVSAWKHLPYWQRKLLRARFQLEIARITLPQTLLNAFMLFIAFMFFIVTPFPRAHKSTQQEG